MALWAIRWADLPQRLLLKELSGQENRKLVLIAPATETETRDQQFFSMVPVDDKTKRVVLNCLTELTEQPHQLLFCEPGCERDQAPVLWVHDRHDNICTFDDVKPLLSLDLPHVKFTLPNNWGTAKSTKTDKVCSEIVQVFRHAHSLIFFVI
jgi:hypothetical protein